MRQTFILAAVFIAAATGGTADARTHEQKQLSFANLALPAKPFTDAVIGRRLESSAQVDYHSGVYRTSDGISVHVFTSDAYPVNPQSDQSTVSFLGSLLHGSELAQLTLYILTPDEVHSQCGFGSTACYYPSEQALYTPGEDTDGLPVEQVMAHEYGHHIAAHRLNTPWDANDWGPKNWASYMGICPGVAAHALFPGAEPPSDNYTLNPGEGWAESYRAYNERAAGTWPSIGWSVVDDGFLPDDKAFEAVREDVLTPWTRNTSLSRSGRLRARSSTQLSLDTPLDGTLVVRATGASSATVQVSDAKGHALSGAGPRETTTICGQASVRLTVHARRSGAYRLSVSEP